MPLSLIHRDNVHGNPNSEAPRCQEHQEGQSFDQIGDDNKLISHTTMKKLYLLVKNCSGLLTADRFDELLEELRRKDWDMVMVSETWRPHPEEHWITEDDYVFAGAGHDSGRKGVGTLLHKRWSKSIIRFEPVS